MQIRTPAGELGLLYSAEAGEAEGLTWLDCVCRGLAGDADAAEFAKAPLVQVLQAMTGNVLAPCPDNFTPESRTPWGGDVIVRFVKQGLGVSNPSGVVGESWEISGHPSFPNRFAFSYGGQDVEVTVRILERLFPELLYGDFTEMPYLVKLLNSGSWQKSLEALERHVGSLQGLSYYEVHQKLLQSTTPEVQRIHREMMTKNLSVQVHPATDPDLKPGEHSKTEACAIVDAEPGAGIYLGLKEGVTRSQFEGVLRSGQDVTPLLNFVRVQRGDVYLIPPGTIHAIGAGVLLLELQETSETTYRVYDFGRTDAHGKPRQSHVDRAMAVTQWEGPRGEALVRELQRHSCTVIHAGTAQVECVLDENVFGLHRITLTEGETYRSHARHNIAGYTVLDGAVTVTAHPHLPQQFSRGESFIIPAAVTDYVIQGQAAPRAVVFKMSAPGDREKSP